MPFPVPKPFVQSTNCCWDLGFGTVSEEKGIISKETLEVLHSLEAMARQDSIDEEAEWAAQLLHGSCLITGVTNPEKEISVSM